MPVLILTTTDEFRCNCAEKTIGLLWKMHCYSQDKIALPASMQSAQQICSLHCNVGHAAQLCKAQMTASVRGGAVRSVSGSLGKDSVISLLYDAMTLYDSEI